MAAISQKSIETDSCYFNPKNSLWCQKIEKYGSISLGIIAFLGMVAAFIIAIVLFAHANFIGFVPLTLSYVLYRGGKWFLQNYRLASDRVECLTHKKTGQWSNPSEVNKIQKIWRSFNQFLDNARYKFNRMVEVRNHGRKESIEKFSEPQMVMELPDSARRFGIEISPFVECSTQREGLCLGSVLYVAKKYLTNGNDLESATSEFTEEGVPEDAVLMQGIYKKLFDMEPNNLEVATAYCAAKLHAEVTLHVKAERFLAQIQECPDGVYSIISKVGTFEGYHAELLVKKGDNISHFDVNTKGIRVLDKEALRSKARNWTEYESVKMTQLTLPD